MSTRLDDPADVSLADLMHQVVEDGRAVARAEVNLYREIALYRIGKAKTGAIAIGAGAVLALAGSITLMVMLAQGLAVHIGPVAGGLVVFLAAGIIAFFLVKYGAAKMAVLGGDADERQAVQRGEQGA